MFRLIEDVPPGVLAVEATGKVTLEDYKTFIREGRGDDGQRPDRRAVLIGADFTDYDLQALG